MLENLNKTMQEQVDTQLHTMVSEASKPIHTRHHSQKETSPLDLSHHWQFDGRMQKYTKPDTHKTYAAFAVGVLNMRSSCLPANIWTMR